MPQKNKKVFAFQNRVTPGRPVLFNKEKCKGCNLCIESCQCDVLIPNPEKGRPPLILFPDECYYCGCCVDACHIHGAIKFNPPLAQRVRFKRKLSGETVRIK